MKIERKLLIISILGIFCLLIISNYNKPILIGEVTKIEQTENSIKIELENHPEEILILNKTKIEKIGKGEIIEVYGNKQLEINKTVLFATKIRKQ